ncbi:MAG TPA: hypothetical protein VHO48_05635 [Anaerolineaceae bacterium]|nr:hypothetical protein [Anaerolineaceae bacterium]
MTQRNFRAALLSTVWLGGLVALFGLLRTPSEPGSAFLLGYSKIRLSLASGTLAVVFAVGMITAAEIRQPSWWNRISDRIRAFFVTPARVFVALAILFTVFLANAAVLVLAVSRAAAELVILKTVLNYLGVLMIWLEASIVVLALLLLFKIGPRSAWGAFFTPLRLAVLACILTVVYTAGLKIYMTQTWDIRMRGLEEFIFLPAIVALAWGLIHHFYAEKAWYPAVARALGLVALGVISYAFYRHTAQWMEWRFTPSKAYWHDLADAFLHGRLYLIDPESTHDLTFFNNHWYVPNPPLPALVLLPFVALFGHDSINTVLVSNLIGAINIVLIYLALEKATANGMIPTRRSGNLTLVALFALGTSHWWLAMMGHMWFVSQLLTLTFTTLAVLAVLYRRSPWLAGLSLGLAILSRPNAFTLWPLLAGIQLFFQQRDAGKLEWKGMVGWAVASAVPVVAAVGGLLFYNYIRFDDFLDFGYVTINSADWLMNAVRSHGMFNPYFIPTNFKMMFLKLPFVQMRGDCLYFSPTHEGVSMLAMTPALIYIFRRLKINWWTLGAWASVVISIGLLLLYHNTGADQMGYRYLMDFVLPVLLLLAVGVGKRTPWLFVVLTAASALLNAAGILWWFGKSWCG